jgi:hypothetical protein
MVMTGSNRAIARGGNACRNLLPLLALMQAEFLSGPAQPRGEGSIQDVMLD